MPSRLTNGCWRWAEPAVKHSEHKS
jgi:hypothetical protein